MIRHDAHPNAHADTRDHVAEFDAHLLRTDVQKKVCYDASPYLVDLSWRTREEEQATAFRLAERREKARQYGWLRRMLDERIHLRDIRARSLSANPTGWKDFPPASARHLGHAIAITVSRFFNEHPLADLTIFSVVHMTGLLIIHLVTLPFRLLSSRANTSSLHAAPSFGTHHAVVPAGIPAPKPEPSPAPIRATEHLVPFRPKLGWRRPLVGFAMAASVFVLPFGAYSSFAGLLQNKDAVVGSGMEGARHLQAAFDAGRTMDFTGANTAFSAAAASFLDAKERLGMLGTVVTSAAAYLPTDHPVSAARPMLIVGREVALGGAVMTRGMEAIGSDRTPAEKVRILREHLDSAIPHFARAAAALEQVSPSALPEGYGEIAGTAKAELPALLAKMRETVVAAELVEAMLGADRKMRYLVVFQNDRELRPTGGFIGSFALVDVESGEVMNLDVPGGGSYDLKGSLREHVIAPRPMHLINPHWQFQDGNWSPDFPTSAQRLTWFYEKSGGPTTDGVIAINASVMERILGAIGPVEMPEYGITVDADNFYIETQTEVELNYDKEENTPKRFLSDLTPKVIERVMGADAATMLAVADVFRTSVTGKDVQVWLRDADTQARASALGWTGEFRDAPGDYLAIVHTNIAGQKTDKVMRESVEHEAKVLADGSAIVTLVIRRAHDGIKGEPFSGVRNVDYLRVYAPKGSTLIEASGFSAPDPKLIKLPDENYLPDETFAAQEAAMRIDRASGTETYEDLGKTVFGNWVMTDPGEESVVTLTYRLPAGTVAVTAPADTGLRRFYDRFVSGGGATLTYSLTVQKQSGANPAAFTSHIAGPRGYYPVWQSHSRTEDDRGRLTLSETLDGDRFSATILQTR